MAQEGLKKLKTNCNDLKSYISHNAYWICGEWHSFWQCDFTVALPDQANVGMCVNPDGNLTLRTRRSTTIKVFTSKCKTVINTNRCQKCIDRPSAVSLHISTGNRRQQAFILLWYTINLGTLKSQIVSLVLCDTQAVWLCQCYLTAPSCMQTLWGESACQKQVASMYDFFNLKGTQCENIFTIN